MSQSSQGHEEKQELSHDRTDFNLSAACLTCERDDRVLFSALSFSVGPGEILFIEGPNGSGKTTLLRALAGLNSHYDGSITFNGVDIRENRTEYQQAMTFLGHKPGVKAQLTASENLAWWLELQGCEATLSIEQALAQVGLRGYEDTAAGYLSAGQHRRVALARLLAIRSPVWILDEPFTAIDKGGVRDLETLIGAQAALGGSVILTTHHDLDLSMDFRRIKLGS